MAGDEGGFVRGREEGLKVARMEGDARVEVVVRARTEVEGQLARAEVELREALSALEEQEEALHAAGVPTPQTLNLKPQPSP